ncbi:ERCC4 domain-containing protein [Bacillus velezensis]|uniref:ERCC4 domain-containing protein n=1 Tax=Bacillus velezensis TaxID=492670 RepID=UPI000FBBE4A4|nr:ERCC4 domain-containing protein [Bacillus velezensis]RUR98783.1 hypothetical protein EFW57_01586 [Bacillus velezensis]
MDTREQKNHHVLDYLRKKKAAIKFKGMKTCDYSAMTPKNEEVGISRDKYLNAAIAEKRSGRAGAVDKRRSRSENEFIRASRHPFTLLVEDLEGYQKILNGKYRSNYEPKALLGSLKTFEVRYNFSAVFIRPNATGNYIYHHFRYMARELLKGGLV